MMLAFHAFTTIAMYVGGRSALDRFASSTSLLRSVSSGDAFASPSPVRIEPMNCSEDGPFASRIRTSNFRCQ